MGLFPSEADVTSSVADKFRAGGDLSRSIVDGIGERLAGQDGDGAGPFEAILGRRRP